MGLAAIGITGLLSAIGAIVALYFVSAKTQGDTGDVSGKLESEKETKQDILDKLKSLYGEMVDVGVCRTKIADIGTTQETLKAERGRITITQAELETVEARLRELEEIERELAASGLETKEELNILEKKQRELTQKNEQLKTKIAESSERWDQLLKDIESNTQLTEQVQSARTQLVSSEEQITTLMIQIEQGNEQYFILKKRCDALDIEYAQLYEKFSEAEAMVGGSKEKKEG